MSEQFKNIFTKLKKGHTQIIKGRDGFHIHVKEIYATNNTTKSVYLDLYFVDSNQVKTYFLKNITLPPKTRFDVPNKKNIELEYKDYIYAEISDPDITSDIDIFCNYIQTEIIFKKIDIKFKNQNQKIITSGLNWYVSNLDINTKSLKFIENSNYTPLTDIIYTIAGDKLTIYKIPNLQPPDYEFIEYPDRYVIDISSIKKKKVLPSTKCYVNISFNITSSLVRDPKWRYSIDDIYLEENIWRDSNTQILFEEGSYYFNFSDVDKYIKPEDQYLKISNNTLAELKFEYKDDYGYIKIKTDYDVDNIRWNVIDINDEMSEDYYLTSMVSLKSGTYTILINEIDGVFEDTRYDVYINSNCEHFLYHNIQEKQAELEMNIDVQNLEFWQINPEDNFESADVWFTKDNILTLYEGGYYINFKDLADYIKPKKQKLYINNNTKVIYSDKYISNLGKIDLTSMDLLSNEIFKSIKWRLINQYDKITEWFKYDDIYETISGEYILEFQNIEDYSEELKFPVNIYPQQKTRFLVNNLFGV